jgi:excisionase family DNA binding protein
MVAFADSPALAPRFLNVAGAAAHVGLSVRSIRNLLSAGKLVGYRPVRGRVLIDRMELEALVSSSTATPRVGRGRS